MKDFSKPYPLQKTQKRSYLRRTTRYPLVFITLFLIISFLHLFKERFYPEKEPNFIKDLLIAMAIDVIDGDTVTLKIEDSVYRARLIGIDAPEMGQIPWGAKAKRHLQKFIRPGDKLRIETDIEKTDKYNRLLVYVFTEDGIFINEQMLKDGYAVLLTIPPNVRYVDKFVKAQKLAKSMKRGIWSDSGLKEMPMEYKRRVER